MPGKGGVSKQLSPRKTDPAVFVEPVGKGKAFTYISFAGTGGGSIDLIYLYHLKRKHIMLTL